MLKAIVNGHTSYEIKEEDSVTYLNGKALEWDVHSSNDRQFHIIHDHKSYNAELVSIDFVSKTIKLKINDGNYEVEIKDKIDLLLEQLGMSQQVLSSVTEIKAPMPGLILQIHVEEGMELKKGDPIMVLEAMKMENIIKSAGEGVVKKVAVKNGDSVEKNQVLISFH